MNVQLVVEPVAGNGYVARGPGGWESEGRTADEAVANFQRDANLRVAAGAKLVTVPVAEPHPILKYAGTWDPNDPVIREWEKAVEAYRDAIDAEDRP